jgi:ABC-type multidrug transport system ATPase subunit
VAETCDFAFDCKQGGTHRLSTTPKDDSEVDNEVERLDKENWLVNITLKAMGLAGVKGTFVGNDTVRGVSGGERRRVTVSEMSFALAPVLCIDELSTGLDAATTYDIIKLILDLSDLSSSIKLLTLLQPSPETFALFDEVIFLHEGNVLYSGPVGDVVKYFEGLGYELPPRVDPAGTLF